MAVELVPTVGAADANTFVSDEEMTAYAERRGQTIWTGNDNQFWSLVTATDDLTLLNWQGARSTATQALAWPRDYVIDPDRLGVGDNLVVRVLNRRTPEMFDPEIIPQRVKDATCELALQYLLGNVNAGAPDANTAVVEKTVGPLTTKYDVGQNAHRVGWARFPRVLNYIRPLLETASGQLVINRV